MKVPNEMYNDELDALNVTSRWFGGSINRLDIFVASIDASVMKDLVDQGLLRSKIFGWEITKLGRQTLEKFNINSLSDTRNY